LYISNTLNSLSAQTNLAKDKKQKLISTKIRANVAYFQEKEKSCKKLKKKLKILQGAGLIGSIFEVFYGLAKTSKEGSLQAISYLISSTGELSLKIAQLKSTNSIFNKKKKKRKNSLTKIASLIQKIMALVLFIYLIFELTTKKADQNLFGFKFENPVSGFFDTKSEEIFNFAKKSTPKKIRTGVKSFLEKITGEQGESLENFVKENLILGLPSLLTIIPGTINFGLTRNIQVLNNSSNPCECQEIEEHKQITNSVLWTDLVCFLESILLIFASPIKNGFKSIFGSKVIATKLQQFLGTFSSIVSLFLNAKKCDKIQKIYAGP